MYICIYNRHRRKLEGHEKGVRSLAYNSDHRFMVSGGFDYDALVWNPYVERLILRLHGHNAPLVGVEMVPNTPQIVTGDASGVVKIWDIRTLRSSSAQNMQARVQHVRAQRKCKRKGESLNGS